MIRSRPSWNFCRYRRVCHSRTFAWKSDADGASTTTTTADNASKLDFLKCTAKKVKPPLLFPWHHSSDHPRRLAEREANFTDLFVGYKTSCGFISAVSAKAHLKVPLWNILLGSGWKEDLADSCSWAFSQSVAGILSNTYNVPMDSIVSFDGDDEDIKLEFNYKPSAEGDSGTDGKEKSTEKKDDSASKISNMMQAKLQNIFASAHKSGSNQIEVHLATKPTDAQLHSLHILPALSRSLAKRHPSLIRKIEKGRADRDPKLSGLKYIDLVEAETRSKDENLETTMFAEVLVYCDEAFWVRDVETGRVVQGYEDGKTRQVIHGVRLERVITNVRGKGGTTLGDWIITDLDDVLDGNQWIQVEGLPWFHNG